LRIAAAIALLGLAGCADDAAPSRPRMAAKFAPAFSFDIAPLGKADKGDAQLLADLMRQEAERRSLGSASRQPFRVGGAMDAGAGPNGLYLVAVLDVSDANGNRVHRIVDEGVRPASHDITYADLQRLAADTVSKLAIWYEASNAAGGGALADAATDAVPSAGMDDTLATGGIDTSVAFPGRRPLSFDIAMGPAPGDGAEALKSALTEALRRDMSGHMRGSGRYLLLGNVTASTIGNGDMGVAIRWLVKTPDGRLVGAVTQTQAVRPSRIASDWGDLAKDAGAAAAEGILALVGGPPRLPGNAS
jgi:hypothetical protein